MKHWPTVTHILLWVKNLFECATVNVYLFTSSLEKILPINWINKHIINKELLSSVNLQKKKEKTNQKMQGEV